MQIDDLIKRTASALVKRGLKKGDVVAIISPNCIEWPVIFFAVIAAGGIVTSCNHLYTPKEMSFQLSNANAKYLVATKSCLSTIDKVTHKVKERFVIGHAKGYTSYQELIRYDSKHEITNYKTPFDCDMNTNLSHEYCHYLLDLYVTSAAKPVIIDHLIACNC